MREREGYVTIHRFSKFRVEYYVRKLAASINNLITTKVDNDSFTSTIGSLTADDITETDDRKWASESGADVTADNTAGDVSNISGITANSVLYYDALNGKVKRIWNDLEMDAAKLYYTDGSSIESLQPAEADADVTDFDNVKSSLAAADSEVRFNEQNIVDVGTVDGRDISSDGEALDGLLIGSGTTSVTSSTHTISATDRTLIVNYAGNVTITWPSSQIVDERKITVVDASYADSSDLITVTPDSGNILGQSSVDIPMDGSSLTFICDGTNIHQGA